MILRKKYARIYLIIILKVIDPMGLLRLASPESNKVTCDLRLPHLVESNHYLLPPPIKVLPPTGPCDKSNCQ